MIEKYEEALKQYADAAKIEESRQLERDKMKLAQIYHNMGVIFQAGQDYAKAIDAYKMSLRNNPSDDETRYNLALAQKQLQDQQDEQQDQDQDQNQDNQDQQQNQDDQEQNQDQQNQNQDQNQDQQEQQPEPSQPENNENEMSRENAEQLLNSVMQDEKETQEKLQKQQVIQGVRLEKDW